MKIRKVKKAKIMTQEELFGSVVAKVKEQTGKTVTKKDVSDIYNGIIGAIYDETARETETSVTVPKLGILKISMKDAYTAKNPRTGEPVEVPETRSVRMVICKALKDFVKEGAEKSAKTAKAKVEKKPVAKKKIAKKVTKKK